MPHDVNTTDSSTHSAISSTTPKQAKSLTSLMQIRHSTRAFKQDPVPFALLREALSVAQNAPSNSNIQPWRLKILTGDALRRLTTALLAAVAAGQTPTTAPIPDAYKHYRSALGKALYGPSGYDVQREDKGGMEKARRRNYTFFDAPVGMIVYMDKSLADVDVMCVGMYLQALTLLLAEHGLASCVQVSVAGYPDVIREVLGIGEDMVILSGVAVGFEDETAGLNKLDMGRDALRDCIEFVQ